MIGLVDTSTDNMALLVAFLLIAWVVGMLIRIEWKLNETISNRRKLMNAICSNPIRSIQVNGRFMTIAQTALELRGYSVCETLDYPLHALHGVMLCHEFNRPIYLSTGKLGRLEFTRMDVK